MVAAAPNATSSTFRDVCLSLSGHARHGPITPAEEQSAAGGDVAGRRFESATYNNVIAASDSYVEFTRGTQRSETRVV